MLVLGLWLAGTFLEDLVPKGALRSGLWSAHFDRGFVLTRTGMGWPPTC